MSFRIVTWNILADAYIKPGRYPNVPKEALNPEFRRKLLLERLVGQGADLYLLQEVEPDAFEAITRALGASFVGHFAQKSGKPEGCALFARKDRVTIVRTDTLRYAAQRKGSAQLAQIALLSVDERALAVANTHLQWEPPGTPRDQHTGNLQLMELLDRRTSYAEDAPWIIGGDFNAISQSPPVEGALERGLRLSCRQQRPWDTCNINRKRRKLDYLLYTPGTLSPRPGQLPRLERDTPMPSMTWPSDHLAVEVSFTWTDG